MAENQRLKSRKLKMPQPSNVCAHCGIRPVAIKKRKLCNPCCLKLFYRKGIFLKSKKTDAERAREIINRASVKYGPDFLIDMELLKTKPFWTLKAVSEKYKISSERVRQLFNVLFDESVSKYHQKKRAKVKADVAVLDSPCDRRHNDSKSSTGKVRVFEKCRDLGFKTTWANGKADLVVNGYRIAVFSHFGRLFRPSRYNRTLYFHFSVSKSKAEDVDFFIFYAAYEHERWFIIPSEILKNKFHQRDKWTIYIPERVTEELNAKNTYWKYEDAWNQLACPKVSRG